MAIHIINNGKLLLAGYDLSGQVNSIALDYGAELLEVTALGDANRNRIGGLKTVAISAEGFWDADVDDVLQTRISVDDVPITIAPENADEGSIAYTLKAILGEYNPFGSLGETTPFSVSGEADGDLIRGTILLNGTKTASGDGAGQQLGAVASGKKLYATLHVIGFSGTSLDVKVQSDDNSGFLSPIDRITFAQKTAIGAEWATPVNGAIADTYWRVTWALVGSSAQFIVIAGIQ